MSRMHGTFRARVAPMLASHDRVAQAKQRAHHMKHVSDDSECMARLAAGDANALRELYQRHGRALLRFSAAMCRSRQAAEDMVHDTFVALMREPISFDPAQGTVFGYLCGVLRHRVSRHFRQQKRWVALDTDDDTSHAHASELTAARR